MEERFIHSFRFKNVLYSLLSMVLAICTVLVFLLFVYIIKTAVTREQAVPVTEESYNSSNQTVLTNKDLLNSLASTPSGQPSTDNGSQIYMAKSQSIFDGVSAGFIGIVTVISLCIGFLSFALYFSIFTRKFSRYLVEISDGINELSTGNFNVSIPIREDDELTEIAMSLNRMANDIKAIIENERSVENKKNELITNVAHDLRTPLTSIIGYLGIVSSQELSAEKREKYIGIAYNKSKRLEKLIEDLFTYTKFEFGQVKLHLISVDIVKMMEQMLEEFYPSFCDNGLEYSFETNENGIHIEADGDLLARAFGNLIQNAIKYGAQGKNVNVIVTGHTDTVTISVINYGEVIPKKDLNNIFDKFYRVDNSRNEEHGGTGLGLAIAKNIINMHGGSIQVRSDLDGTVFEVELRRE